MKRVIRILIILAILFAIVCMVTASIERPIDGGDFYGFPLVFLTECVFESSLQVYDFQ
jgi:hypothetical protein